METKKSPNLPGGFYIAVAMLVFTAALCVTLFAGEPDLVDALIQYFCFCLW